MLECDGELDERRHRCHSQRAAAAAASRRRFLQRPRSAADPGQGGAGGGGARRLVARIVAGVLATEEHVDFVERRPAFLVALPALAQEVVDLTRAQRRPLEHRGRRWRGRGGAGGLVVVPALAVVDHLVVRQRRQRRLARERQHLPRRHAERPDVALRRETTLHRHTTPMEARCGRTVLRDTLFCTTRSVSE